MAWAVPGLRPKRRHIRAVESREKAAEKRTEPKISGACRFISRRCPKILKPNERMTTPSRLMSQSPAPQAPAACTVPATHVRAQLNVREERAREGGRILWVFWGGGGGGGLGILAS